LRRFARAGVNLALARFASRLTRVKDAPKILHAVWPTEGFDTADLKDAKELLDELAT
jgi:hypothetical protein